MVGRSRGDILPCNHGDCSRRPLPEEAGIVPEVSATRSHVRPLRVSEDQSHPMAAGACLRAAAAGEYRHRLLGRGAEQSMPLGGIWH